MNTGKHFHSFMVLLEIYVDFLSFSRALFYLELFHLNLVCYRLLHDECWSLLHLPQLNRCRPGG